MKRPFEVELPTNGSAGQIIACTVTLLRALGWELGQRYDHHMRPRFGDTWLEDLRRRRNVPGANPMYRRKLNLVDPSFGINEPLRNSDSPLRGCLPSGREFYDLLQAVGHIRNQEQHFDRIPTLQILDGRALILGRLATAIGLPLADDCARVRERVQEFLSGGGPKRQAHADLFADLKHDRERAKDLAQEVAKLRRQLSSNAQALEKGVAAEHALKQQLQAAEAARQAAQDELQMAGLALEEHLANERAGNRSEDMGSLQPGEAWPVAPPSRALSLLPHVGDLYDPAATDLLSNQVGGASVRAAESWREYLPHGGTVLLSDGGHGVALVKSTWTYLGSLDPAQEPS